MIRGRPTFKKFKCLTCLFIPRNNKHEPDPDKNEEDLADKFAQFLDTRGALSELQQLWNNAETNVEEPACSKWEGQISDLDSGAKKTGRNGVLIRSNGLIGRLGQGLDRDTDHSAQVCSNGRDKLRAHGLPFGETTLNQQGKIPHFVWDLVEKHRQCCSAADRVGDVERGRNGQSVGNIVTEIVGLVFEMGIEFLDNLTLIQLFVQQVQVQCSVFKEQLFCRGDRVLERERTGHCQNGKDTKHLGIKHFINKIKAKKTFRHSIFISTMLRREPTTIKLTPDDVKEFYREQTYNTIVGTTEMENQNQGVEREQKSIKERVLGEREHSR
ncbi:hypothetical protein OGAPHI_005866 [Ogataea philodendri]|uniref:Uncharacterized protein n=1 Tax=Ogataea philodendri TaxID=1378263 RepID=A0A9P8T1Y0_9ASCO|nr:uncharacterized protein OGAPHI_005866 [Ogataea philodendri]KAH3662614.1 hypothetical protein OGAPHI_005866 [Ogataea philodendri]